MINWIKNHPNVSLALFGTVFIFIAMLLTVENPATFLYLIGTILIIAPAVTWIGEQ